MAEPITTTRGMALQNLSKQLPVANARIAQGQQAAQTMQIQQAVKAAPPVQNTQQAAAQTGAAVAQSAGAQLIQNAQQGVQAQGQVAQVAQSEQVRAGAERLEGLSQGAKQDSVDNVQKLAQINEQAKQELYDRQMTFAKDARGRTLFSQEQLLDYAKTKAQSDEEFKSYTQSVQIATQRNLQAMETAYRNVDADLKQKQALAEQTKDQDAARRIAQMRQDAADQMARETAKANNNAAIMTTVGMVAGAAAGAMTGTPQGAMAGASLGGALGGMAGSQTNKNSSQNSRRG